jgi:hypothetical protein
MANTRIVLNKQSDLILNEASIVKPKGIEKADLPGLVDDLANLVVADSAEASKRKAEDDSIKAKLSLEMSTETSSRVAGDVSLQAEIDTLEVEHAADISTAAANLAAEASRAQAAEASNASALAAEIASTDADFAAMDAAYKAADAAMETKHNSEMSAEISSRIAGDADNAAAIATEKGRIDAILEASVADADSFAEIVNLINSVDTENDQAFAAYVLSNDAALSNEVVRAGAAEASLEAALAAEISATDVDLASLEVKHNEEMSIEASTRVAIDEAQDAALSQEVVDRQTADNAIQANLDNEVADRIAQDQLQATNLTAETSRATAAELSLESALAAEASATDADFTAMDVAYKAADSVEKAAREAAISSEASARVAGDQAEAAARIAGLNAEASTRAAADASMEAKHNAEMSTEVARAESAEASLGSALAAEASATDADFAAMDAAYKAADSVEKAAREAADATLQSNIDAETARIDAILNASEADKDSFAEIVTLINSVDTENDQAFAAYVLKNEEAVATEIANRVAGDSSLETALNNEVVKLKEELAKESEARQNVDKELDGKIANIISNTDITSMDSFSEVSAEIMSVLAKTDEAIQVEGNTRGNADTVLYDNDWLLKEGVDASVPYMAGFNELPDGVAVDFTTDIYINEIVFLNGLMQLKGVDYTFGFEKESGTGKVTFTSAPSASDMINIYGIGSDYFTYLNENLVDPNGAQSVEKAIAVNKAGA